MRFHLIQSGMIGNPEETQQGFAGQRRDLFQRYLHDVAQYVELADDLGYAGYGHNEHHLQIEGFEASNHPGMLSLFVGNHSKRLTVGTLGYVLPTHNPLRAAEEIATLDHMLKGRLLVGFLRGYQSRWVDSLAALPGIKATTPELAKNRDMQDTVNREIFEESLKIVKMAWTNSTFSYKGKYWQFPPEGGSDGHSAYELYGGGLGLDGRVEEVGIAPLPYQSPHPKIYGAFAHSMRTAKFWAREGGKMICMANDLDFSELLWKVYKETALEHGLGEVSNEDTAAWGGVIIVGRDQAHVDRLLEIYNWVWNAWLVPFGQQSTNIISGTPSQVADTIGRAHDRLGFNECWLQFGQGYFDANENLEMIDRFASEVMPQFSSKDETGMFV